MFGVSVPTYEAMFLSFPWTASSSLSNLHIFAKIDVSGGTLAVEAIKHISLYVSRDTYYVRYEFTWNHCATKENSREKWRKWISLTVAPVGQAREQIIDKLDEACTNGDDRMMLVQHSSGDRVMS